MKDNGKDLGLNFSANLWIPGNNKKPELNGHGQTASCDIVIQF